MVLCFTESKPKYFGYHCLNVTDFDKNPFKFLCETIDSGKGKNIEDSLDNGLIFWINLSLSSSNNILSDVPA